MIPTRSQYHAAKLALEDPNNPNPAPMNALALSYSNSPDSTYSLIYINDNGTADIITLIADYGLPMFQITSGLVLK